MPRDDLTALARTVRTGHVLLVQYNGCTLRPLWGCAQSFAYEYTELPEAVTGADGAVLRGSFKALGFDAAAPRSSTCADATHAVVSATAGAFERQVGDATESFGNDATCRENPHGAECAVPILIELSPLKPQTSAACPAGYEVTPEGGCVPPPPPQCEYGFGPDRQCLSGPDGWFLPPRDAPAFEEVSKLVLRLTGEKLSDEAQTATLTALVAAYRKLSGAEADRSRVRALKQLVRSAPPSAETLKLYQELVQLSASAGERSDHLDAANRMRDLFPHAPESAIAYLALARYYCEAGQPSIAERFFAQLRDNIKQPPPEASAEAEKIRQSCSAKPMAE
jgi:hypothetical protein